MVPHTHNQSNVLDNRDSKDRIDNTGLPPKRPRFCVCGRADSQEPTPDIDSLNDSLGDVMERKRELARECATDSRVLRDVVDLRNQELELRAAITRAAYASSENSTKTQP